MISHLLKALPLVGSLFLFSCSSGTHNQVPKEKVRTPVYRLVKQDVDLNKLYVSDIQAAQNVEIRSRISGFLDRIHVDEGSFVQKGQLLFSLSNGELQADISRARAAMSSLQAEVRTTEVELEKVRLLVDKKIISNTELQVAQARVNAARARVDEARAAVQHAQSRQAYTQIRAPYSGVIDRIPLKIGSLLEEGTLLTTLSDVSNVLVYFNLSENEYLDYPQQRKEGKIPADREATLILANGEEYPYSGKVETIVSEIEESTGSIAIRTRFPNPDHVLKHGATGKIRLTREEREALVVPQKAVFEIQDKDYVYLVDAQNKVKMKSFVPGARLGEFYVVESGLSEGDRIVYEGIQGLKEGMEITPKTASISAIGRVSGPAARGGEATL